MKPQIDEVKDLLVACWKQRVTGTVTVELKEGMVGSWSLKGNEVSHAPASSPP